MHESPSRDGAVLMALYVPEQVWRPHLLGVHGVEVEIYGGVGPGVPHNRAVSCRVPLQERRNVVDPPVCNQPAVVWCAVSPDLLSSEHPVPLATEGHLLGEYHLPLG